MVTTQAHLELLQMGLQESKVYVKAGSSVMDFWGTVASLPPTLEDSWYPVAVLMTERLFLRRAPWSKQSLHVEWKWQSASVTLS